MMVGETESERLNQPSSKTEYSFEWVGMISDLAVDLQTS
jgi:hypothetical protein